MGFNSGFLSYNFQLGAYKETIPVCFEKYTKHNNELCRQNVGLLNAELLSPCSYH